MFARGTSVWRGPYLAKHVGAGDWAGTNQTIGLAGRNCLEDIYIGSDDATILLLTDDANGDAFFVDDIYSAFPEGVDAQARMAKIDEIRAGAGDDIIDLTSQRFDYVGGGIKSRDITLPTKVPLVNAMVFPVVMHGCESWTVKKAEC